MSDGEAIARAIRDLTFEGVPLSKREKGIYYMGWDKGFETGLCAHVSTPGELQDPAEGGRVEGATTSKQSSTTQRRCCE